jgi:transcriptional regulator with PAS, ATPase and Fis domain
MITPRQRISIRCRHEGSPGSADFNANTHDLLIRQSHERSRQYGIDPNLDKAPVENSLSADQLRQRIQDNQPFFDLVTTQLSTLNQILKGSGFAMAVADKEGYILNTLGDGPIMAQYQSRNCIPGFRWTERDVGTCAIGLVLHARTPIQLSGAEMFSLSAQHITNSAAPVYDDEDRLLGVIALSGHTEQVHMHTLGMVILAAETIRSQVCELKKAGELALRNWYMSALLESDHRGVIALDRGGRIVQLNQKAKRLLRLDDDAEGRRIDTLVLSNLKLSTYLNQGLGFAERELTYTAGSTGQTLISALDPITMPDGETAGGLLLLMERKRVMKLVNEMAGSQARFTFDSIIGKSGPVSDALKLARVAARGKASVLLYGETGTGKELFAQAIHNAGPRRDNPFVVINCGAVPKELLESELFGYAEGAFTGARKGGRPGKFELADGGTLFLDEIGDMPLDMQVKILRALQSGEVQRVGGRHPITVDMRIIVATNVDLDNAIAEGRFRQDLYYRISTLRIDIPSLRERQTDVLDLANAFLERIRPALGKPDLIFSPQALELIGKYPWPGNIRQLENSVERAVNIAEGPAILPEDFGLTPESEVEIPLPVQKNALLKDMERTLIVAQMDQCGGNISKAARMLGVSRPTLYRKLRKYGLATSP